MTTPDSNQALRPRLDSFDWLLIVLALGGLVLVALSATGHVGWPVFLFTYLGSILGTLLLFIFICLEKRAIQSVVSLFTLTIYIIATTQIYLVLTGATNR